MPSIGVSVAVFNEGKVLLTRRKDFPVWCLPGGGINAGETAAHAAIRETLEETGVEVKLTRLVGVYSRPNWWDGGDHSIVFIAEPIGGALVKMTNETVDATFFPVDQLPTDIFWWHAQRILDADAGLTGVVRTQDIRPLTKYGRDSLVQAIEDGEISVDEVLGLVAGSPRHNLQTLDVKGR